ncbi:11195_t:CDS:2, partial [Dentiscutata erythropus]
CKTYKDKLEFADSDDIQKPHNYYIYDLFELYTTIEDDKENNQLGIQFSYTIDISLYNESSKKIADNLINIVSDIDKYN